MKNNKFKNKSKAINDDKNLITVKLEFKNNLLYFHYLRLENIGRNFTHGSDNLENITFVSIHVRRTDYAHHMSVLFNLTYVEDSYFFNAIQYFRKNFDVRI